MTFPGAASAQDQIPISITPPSWIQVCDRPNDNGNAVIITWEPSAQDQGLVGPITGYEILRALHQRGPFETVGRVRSGSRRYVDTDARSGVPYYYKVLAVTASESITSELAGPVHATHQWFDRSRLNLLFIGLLVVGIMTFSIFSARSGTEPTLRRLPGIDALEAAIASAASEDRPILFVNGSEDLNDIGTIAGLSILDQVASRTAQHDVELLVPHLHSLVMSAAADTIDRAYVAGGKPGIYDQDANFYVSDEQFGFVAGVGGIMSREEPAACLYFGSFFAEALSLAEMGQTIGATQIAGTNSSSQIPFLLAACDHVLIGEELYAAQAYLSRDPRQIGCLKGQDFGKAVAVLAISVGCALATLATLFGSEKLQQMKDAWLALFQSG